MRQGGSIELSGDELRASPPPRAFALNETSRCEGIEITLCSFVLVDELARVTGVVRVDSRPDVRLGSVPSLVVTSERGSTLDPVAAHVMPHGGMSWVSWLFRHPAGSPNEYEARIDRVDVDYRAGGRPPMPQLGPWLFRFRVSAGPSRPTATSMPSMSASGRGGQPGT
jgi:hypothetical protein